MIVEALQSDWASVPASMLPISHSLTPTFSRNLRSTTTVDAADAGRSE